MAGAMVNSEEEYRAVAHIVARTTEEASERRWQRIMKMSFARVHRERGLRVALKHKLLQILEWWSHKYGDGWCNGKEA